MKTSLIKPALKKSLTLFELIIAISLLSVLILAFSSMELFSRRHVLTLDRQAQLQNEASFALEHMRKNIVMAIGNMSDTPMRFYPDNRGIRIRIDDTPANGRVDATDTWIGYRHVGSQILFLPNDPPPGGPSPNSVVIANHILTTDPGGLTIVMPAINQLNITVEARWVPNPATPVSLDNPTVILTTSIIAPAVSTN